MFGSFAGAGLGFGVAFTLVDRFTSTASRIQQSLGRLGMDVQAFQKKVSGGFTTMTIGAAVLGAGLLTLSPIFGAIKEAANFEQTTIAFETMFAGIGKSKEAAHGFLKEMESFAATTPFTLPDVEKNTRLLMAMGIEQEKLLPSMRMLGDVAAGLSVPLERLALNFGQIKAQGKLSGRDLRDFATAGVPILDALGKVLNKSKKEVSGMVTDGLIDFDLVEKAFQEGMPQFHDLMLKQSASLNGVWSNLEDNLTITSRRMGEAFLPIAKKLGAALLVISNWARQFVQTPIGKAIMYVVAAFGALLVIAGSVLIVYGAWIIASAVLTAAFELMAGAVAALLVEFLPFIIIGAIIGGIVYAVYRLGKSLEAAGAQNNFFVMLVNLGSVLQACWQALRSFNTETQSFELDAALANKLQKLGLLDFVMGIISWLIRLKAFFVGVWEGMVEGFRYVKQVVSEVWDYIKPTILGFFEQMGIHLDRNMSKLETWKKVGKVVGYVIIGVLGMIALAFAAMAIAAIIALSPLLLIIYVIYKAIQLVANSFVGKGIAKLWNWATNSKDSKDGMSNTPIPTGGDGNPAPNPFGGFGMDNALMFANAKGKANQQATNTPIMLQAPDKSKEQPIINNFIVDGEPLYQKLMDRNEIEQSRK